MRLRLAAVLLALCSGTAFAQVAEFGFNGGAMSLSGEELGSNYFLDAKWKFGFRITLNNWRFLGGEFGYNYARHRLRIGRSGEGGEAGFAGHQGFVDGLAYATPEGSRVRPFAAGGFHFTNYVFPGTSVTQGSGSTKFGLNYGAGIKFRVAQNWLIRADFRQYWNGKPWADIFGGRGRLRTNEISLGASFAL
ncbi:MAG TPA: outer membrane beta-barrel protein [Bryobacteraceae bacterium]|nr:outer membrane beta-barrel protein [Bryobacteraceae bacterium]